MTHAPPPHEIYLLLEPPPRLCFTESEPPGYRRRLRSHRHLRAHWESCAGLQRQWHRAEALVRHVGITQATDRAVAHVERS